MAAVPARAMIEAENVAKRFGTVEAVRGISFAVRAGEIVGFLGPNGAGKTTTLRMLAGIFPPTAGAVRIDGHDVAMEPLACRRAVGYFPENAPYYPELRVREYLAFVARLKRLPRAAQPGAIAAVLAACTLGDVAGRRIGTLSKGFRQRVGLAQALLGDPPVLILDEPTIGLDPGQVVEIRELIGGLRGARTVLFSSHILSEVEALCERVIVISRGTLVAQGSPRELAHALGARQRVTVRVDAPADEVAPTLAALPGVDRVERQDGGWLVEATGEGALARRVGESMQRQGVVVLELRQETLDLEDVFLELVRGGPRA